MVNQHSPIQASENEQTKALQEESEAMEKLLNRRSILLQKREELEKKIRDIGPLPTAELENVKSKSLKELLKLLHETNQKLKGFTSVNKKALDQYLQFTDQREDLQKRKQELDEALEVLSDSSLSNIESLSIDYLTIWRSKRMKH